MTKDRKYPISAQPIKFNKAQINLDSDGIVLTKESYVSGILLVTDHNADFTSSRGITRKNLSPEEQYLAQRSKDTYISSLCQPEASFDLSRSAQTIKFSTKNIALLNKRLQWQITNKS